MRLFAGQLTAARENALAALDPHRAEAGLTTLLARLAMAGSLYGSGAWDQALSYADMVITQSGVDRIFGLLPGAHAWAAMVAAGRGRWRAAQEHVNASKEAAAKTVPGVTGVLPVLADMVLAQARGDLGAMDRCLAVLDAMPPTGRRQPYRLFELPLRFEALLGAGRLDEAAELAAELKASTAYTGFTRHAAAWAAGALAEAHGDPDAALDAYSGAFGHAQDRDEAPAYMARLELAYGSLLLRRDDKQRAAHALTAAQRRYSALGAAPGSEQAAAYLAACGLEQRRSAARERALDTLTEREEAVARLAAAGLTNREIAKDLCISSKTVEYHLGHIYTKLGVTSRRQMRASLA
jgi:DNA-binding CsgD family transcriptional regulator